MIRHVRLIILLSVTLTVAAPHIAGAASLEPQNYRRAFSALDNGNADLAYGMTARLHDTVLNKVLRAYFLAAPGNDASFAETADFIGQNPDWPNLRDIRMMAEQKIPPQAGNAQVIGWFRLHPPLTLIGFYRYTDALNAAGQTQAASDLIRKRWIDNEFSNDELTAFYTRFGAWLNPNDHYARLDRLLWSNDAGSARRLYGLIDNDAKIVAEARVALAGQKPDAEDLLARVPGIAQNDPGLLYEHLRWLRRNNRDEDAIDILKHPPSELGRPEAWWQERQILIRRAMDGRDYGLAYRLAASHEPLEGFPFVQAEFLAGWLALRFLNQPDDARVHFETLYEHSTTPISRARGAYWLGRTYEALNDRADAEQSYENAAVFNIAYYGQLAQTRLYEAPIITAKPEPPIPARVRATFYARDTAKAVERLHNLGENDRARAFFKSIIEMASSRADFVLLTELAYQIKRPDLAIEAAKAANQKNMLVAAGGFPLMDAHLPKVPEPAFTFAMIRQESMFNPEAASSAGAQGLMQLMPRTAKAMAQKLGLKFREKKLCEPDYNLRIGTAFVQNQIEAFNGSYVLALAGYNAGPSRVREWMTQIGDPRDPQTDPVDWIELIPVPETRNYIQRILENLQIYRARLNGGAAPLLILQDLRR